MTAPSHDAEFYLSHAGYVRALARRIVFDPDLADDLEQQIWVAALERAPREASSARAWLGTVARNFAAKTWRGTARRSERELSAARARPSVPTPDEIVEYESARRRVVEALIALDEPYRTVLFLRFFEELEPREIAERLGLPVETVRTRIKRALERMRASLRRDGPHGAWGLALATALRLEPPPRGAAWKWVGDTLVEGALVMGVAKQVGLVCAAIAVLVAAVVMWSPGEAAAPRPAAGLAAAEDLERAADAPPRGEELERAQVAGAASANVAPQSEPIPTATSGALLVRAKWFDGTPAAGIGLRIYQVGVEDFEHHSTTFVTSADGTQLVEGIMPGLVLVEPDRGGYGSTVVEAGAREELEVVLPRGADVDGIVTDDLDRPVGGAEIFLHIDHGPGYAGFVVARSGEDGRFEIRSVVPHSGACVSARAAGRAPTAQNVIAAVEGATVKVHLTFAKAGTRLSGRVVDPDGRGVAGATVLLGEEEAYDAAEFADGSRGYEPCAQLARTSSDGAFAFEGVALERLTLQARARGFAPWREEIDAAHAGALEVRLQPSATLRGTVRDAAGEPVFGAMLTVGRELTFESVSVRSARDGSYVARNLPLGEIAVEADGLARGKARTTLSVEAGAELRWDARLDPGLSLVGRIIAGDRALNGWLVHLQSSPSSGLAEPYVANLETDAEGRFEFTSCPDVEFDLSVCVPGDFAFPVAHRQRVRAGARELALELDLSNEPNARIAGRLVDPQGNALGSVQLSCVRAGNGPSRSYSSQLDTGRFEIGPLPAGEWALEVRARGFAPMRTAPRTLAPHETLEVGDISVDIGGTIVARLDPAAGVVAKVEWMRAEREDGAWSEFLHFVEGEARSGPLSAGRWRLVPLDEGGGELAPIPVEVRAGVETRVQVDARSP